MPETLTIHPGRRALELRAAAGDAEAAAALRVLSCRLFDGDSRAWSHVTAGGIDWDAILDDGSWSTGERKVLEAGHALWTGRGAVDLVYVFTWLGDEDLQVVLDAIVARRGGVPLPTNGVQPAGGLL